MNRKCVVAILVMSLVEVTRLSGYAITTIYAVGRDSFANIDAGENSAAFAIRASGGIAFGLDDGQSSEATAFSIETIPPHTPANPKPSNATISATINIVNSVTTAVEHSINFEGLILFDTFPLGQVIWSTPAQTVTDFASALAPTNFEFGRRTFTVALSDEIFTPGILGSSGAGVRAIVTQITSTAREVPDSGGTAALLGLGILAIRIWKKSYSDKAKSERA
jgi:VPDSG-CTERM motif